MTNPRFYPLRIKKIHPEAGQSASIVFDIPENLKSVFRYVAGQFLTIRQHLQTEELRRNYSISCSEQHYDRWNELEIGIRPVPGGKFSNWAVQSLKENDVLEVMPPDGRFVIHKKRALHRVGFAVGSGITPILSIMSSSLAAQPETKFTLVYGNRRMSSVMYNEALQDLKDQYPDRLTLLHVLSRQAQEVDMLEGRINEQKIRQLVSTLLPVASMDEVFICGPSAMIDETEATLITLGVPADRIRTERFSTGDIVFQSSAETSSVAHEAQTIPLTVILDGKQHELSIGPNQKILDVALNQGLDLPYSCKAGVCCTCRVKVLEGQVQMEKNFTLDAEEMQQGFVLSCQAKVISDRIIVSFDER